MSRIGKKPVIIPTGVKVEQKGQSLKVTGPLGTLEMNCHPAVKVKVDENDNQVLVINEKPQQRRNKQLHGTMRALINNMVTGVSKGFERKMEIYGTGYSVKEQGEQLVLQVGFSHPVKMQIPKGLKVNVDVQATRGDDVPAKFTISGVDKQLLGQFTSDIRKMRPPEPYKGKGIRYTDEQVRRKAGKAFASGGV
ncbi:MAG: 50S ribosomal protein L6 [Planctomycetota bacterium]|jgi:large subunit ribosomal protein L6